MKLFNQVKGNYPKRTQFDLSHERKLSCKIGQLIPIMVDEVVPGDTFSVNSEVLARMAPTLAPIMHRMNVYVHYFYVPNRIIWKDWKTFITGEDELLHTDIAVPKFNLNNSVKQGKGTLADYFGLPVGVPMTEYKPSQLPFRAYHAIWNEYYRDQNLQEETKYLDWDENPTEDWYTVKQRAWEKDYFTSALPWAQKTPDGQPVGIPVQPNYITTGSLAVDETTGGWSEGTLQSTGGQINDGTHNVIIKNMLDGQEMEINLNEFRQAHRIQKWFERQARAGSRYVETMLSHYGQKIPDLYDRPEFLGGGKTPMIISEVINQNANQTAGDGDTNMPLGDMAGHGIAIGKMNRTTAQFKEHGWIMGIMSVMPKTAYQNGVHKSFSRTDRFDFFWPEFSNLGEQPVLNKELWMSSDLKKHEDVFGYQSMYAEYKYKGSSVHGDMRDELKYWHMGRFFARDDEPRLNEKFVECDHAEVSRVFAVPTKPDGDKDYTNKDHLWVQVYNDVKANRPMPYYGTPTL